MHREDGKSERGMREGNSDGMFGCNPRVYLEFPCEVVIELELGRDVSLCSARRMGFCRASTKTRKNRARGHSAPTGAASSIADNPNPRGQKRARARWILSVRVNIFGTKGERESSGKKSKIGEKCALDVHTIV